MRRLARPLRTLVCAAAAAAILAVVAGRFGAIYIAGRSMEPCLRPGDLVVFRRGALHVSEGDVVVLRRPGERRAVVHRVVGLAADGSCTTCGDANEFPDRAPAAAQMIQGVVVGILPLGRAVSAVVAGVSWCYNRLPIANTRL